MHRPGGLLVGAPLLLLCWFILAAMAAWIILGLPLASFEPLRMPQFFWYYRGDALVVRAHRYQSHLIVNETSENGDVLILRVPHAKTDWLTD